ncbi:allantoate amidohydrolase [Marinomonas dokdonensis]|uniref:allantoate amidohydrolase n=1 Tax=Marinomonas dokdonensis TaxID=328224 RepID=UPI0040554CF3
MKDTSRAAKVMEQAEVLATFTDIDYGLSRSYLTPEHKAANGQIATWMQQAGLEIWQDSVGNQWGRKVAKDPSLPTLLLGSHSDTVVNAGKYDGMLGVLLAIEALDALKEEEFPFHIDVVAFADEEGTRFNTTLIGSSAVSGDFDPAWLEVEDANGITMAQAMETFGLDPALAGKDNRTREEILAYLEVHIEQGPVLENEDLAVGVVTGIAGAKRYQVSLTGVAGHAGTVPMSLRQDALPCAAQMMLAIEKYAMENGVVATVGKCQVEPGAVNVIPGKVTFTIDIRSQVQSRLENACSDVLAFLETIALERAIDCKVNKLYEAEAVPCDEGLQQQWARVVERHTQKAALSLSSGAGHDAMIIANIADIGMLFVRCEKGISHNPREKVETPDVAVALDCFVSMIKSVGAQYKSTAEPLFGLGIGGNSAGHLEQTGEINGFDSPAEQAGPQAIFPFYVPQCQEAYLACNPYSSSLLKLPLGEEGVEPKVQIEPELALKVRLQYADDKSVVGLSPYAMTLVNDVSFRNAKVTKLAEKKNWGEASKGLASQEIALANFSEESSLEHYRICGFLQRDGKWMPCSEDVSVAAYSYFYEPLLDWVVARFAQQKGEGILHNLQDLLAQASYPSEILLSVGAARYNAFGEGHNLQVGDKTLVALYDSSKHSYQEVFTLISSNQDLEAFSTEDVMFLQQTVV